MAELASVVIGSAFVVSAWRWLRLVRVLVVHAQVAEGLLLISVDCSDTTRQVAIDLVMVHVCVVSTL